MKFTVKNFKRTIKNIKRNVLPFLVYGLFMLAIIWAVCFVLTLPELIGLLVFG